ncbi:MAG TPA: M20/M25/M40 family metallo-hydrolase [Pyrinomonadaceae bacterium]|nr:M20/M25/M40 family metallo-hydrolase [Pyrinomonadaceae bacterium]
MKNSNVAMRLFLSVVLAVSTSAGALTVAQQRRPAVAGTQQGGRVTNGAASAAAPQVLERNVRAHMEFLASDAMQGRGSGTQFELLAGQYIASQLRQYGVEPAGDAAGGATAAAAGQQSFLQTIALRRQAFAAAPALSFSVNNAPERRWVHGKEMVVARMSAGQLKGTLQKLGAGERPAAGAFVLLGESVGDARQLFQQASALGRAGAAAVFIAETAALRQRWAAMAAELPQLPLTTEGARPGASIFVLSTDAYKELQGAPDGTSISVEGALAPSQTNYTWNVVGVLRGSDAKLAQEAVILSAHMDHLGVGAGQGGDQIYNGADDDASGVVAVLELARALAGASTRPKRTIYFVLFGSEEKGGHGAQHFLAHPPVALTQMVANLEFEMIGRPDAKVAADTLWLTGYERSNLGAELARQGARLVQDPHPEENFFQRSDNYALARRGVVAHTVSSFGLHPEYHQPSDDIAHIDFAHMTRAINSMVAPVIWLVNSNFTPAWVEGKKP